jgi:VIT1/CCC1 family predicted Fe2+/Mn2+ transporter
VRRRIQAHLASLQVPRVIYGAIIGLALVVALEAHPPGAGLVAGSLLATAIAVGLAELYSEVVGTQVRTRRRVGREHLHELLTDTLAVAFGVAFPAVFFVLAAFDLIDLKTAFTVAKWSGLALIGLYGFTAARLAGRRFAAALLEGAAVGAIGGALIAFKALIH